MTPWAADHGITVRELHRVKRDGQVETLWQQLMRPESRSIQIPVRMDNGAYLLNEKYLTHPSPLTNTPITIHYTPPKEHTMSEQPFVTTITVTKRADEPKKVARVDDFSGLLKLAATPMAGFSLDGRKVEYINEDGGVEQRTVPWFLTKYSPLLVTFEDGSLAVTARGHLAAYLDRTGQKVVA